MYSHSLAALQQGLAFFTKIAKYPRPIRSMHSLAREGLLFAGGHEMTHGRLGAVGLGWAAAAAALHWGGWRK